MMRPYAPSLSYLGVGGIVRAIVVCDDVREAPWCVRMLKCLVFS